MSIVSTCFVFKMLLIVFLGRSFYKSEVCFVLVVGLL